MLTATIWGGAGEHGRSCYHIERGGVSVLLDCGVKKAGAGEYPLLDASRIRELSAVFLSHAHEDHSIGLPLLYQLGYTGEVWTTRATMYQLPAYFELWGKHVERQGGQLPYNAQEVGRIRFRCLEESAAAGNWFEAAPGVKVCWGPSGHLPGAVWLLLDLGGKTAFYSGDYSGESSLLRADLPALADSDVPDLAIIDAAYGDRSEVQEQEVGRLVAKIREVLGRGGHVFLPVPLYGRGQELLTLVSEAVPEAAIICEAGLLQGFRDLEAYGEWLRPGALERTRQALNRNVTIVHTETEREAALAGPPTIIFAPDGLLQTPVAQYYYRRLSGQSRHALLFTGHLYEGCFGAEVWQAHRIRGEGHCEVMRFHYKIHQGLPDVERMLKRLRPRQTLLVHANKEKTDRLAARLPSLGYTGIHSLMPGDELRI